MEELDKEKLDYFMMTKNKNTKIVLFHPVIGCTDGVHKIAQHLESQGFKVLIPDLFYGETFANLDTAMSYVESLTHQVLIDRAKEAVSGIEEPFIAAGVSLGALFAQYLAHTDTRVKGLILLESFLDPEYLPGNLPEALPITVHGGEADPWFAEDFPAAKRVSSEINLDLNLYPEQNHLFTISDWDTYNEQALNLVINRIVKWFSEVSF